MFNKVLGSIAFVILAIAIPIIVAQSQETPGLKPVRVERSWSGFIDDLKLLQHAPQSKTPKRFHIADTETFAALWKAWRPKDSAPPDIDFKAAVICVLASESADEIEVKPHVGNDGDVAIMNTAKKGGKSGFSYKIVQISRAGVSKVAGIAIDAKPMTAEEFGKQWRYPGTGNEADKKGDDWVWEFTGPVDEKPLKNLNRTSLQMSQPKASFDDVWNFYAGKCGYTEKRTKNRFVAIIEKTNDGQRMITDMFPGVRIDYKAQDETHFAFITVTSTVHVEIRKIDADYTAIRVFTALK
jgi:hypothetical protein